MRITSEELNNVTRMYERNLIIKGNINYFGPTLSSRRISYIISYFYDKWNIVGYTDSCFHMDGKIATFLLNGYGLEKWKGKLSKKDVLLLSSERSFKRV